MLVCSSHCHQFLSPERHQSSAMYLSTQTRKSHSFQHNFFFPFLSQLVREITSSPASLMINSPASHQSYIQLIPAATVLIAIHYKSLSRLPGLLGAGMGLLTEGRPAGTCWKAWSAAILGLSSGWVVRLQTGTPNWRKYHMGNMTIIHQHYHFYLKKSTCYVCRIYCWYHWRIR